MLRLVAVYADLFAVDERKKILLELGDGVDLAVDVVKKTSAAGDGTLDTVGRIG